ncbi:hypothetical protein ACS0TY_034304 [Phlomoides rotata]
MADSDYPPPVTEIVDQNTAAIVGIDDDLEMLEQDAENANEDVMITNSTAIVPLDNEVEIVEQGAENANGGDSDGSKYSGSLLGMTGNTIEEMYEMYCRHARVNKFSVRKATTRLSTTGVELAKLFVCSCAGLKRSAAETTRIGTSRKEKRVGITRTNCKALLSVKMNKERIYEVIKHEMKHNHQLTWSHHHRSKRKTTDEKGKAIEPKATEFYPYIAYEAGGQEDVGHTMRDHINFVTRMKVEKIEPGDAQTFIDMILEENEQDQEFFYSVKLDSEARLTNIFWRDSLMKEDYTIYGDVVVFDTTYRTNKYNLICAPFFGINNHGKNVMFGCAFISDETTESFEWLFKAFRKSMGEKYPISIFTDHDLAIADGIEKVFPETRHRLCPWHLLENALGRFEKLKSENSFKDAFNKCLSGCMDESDFEITWKKMVTTYGLQDNPWFTRLYGLKEKWCTTLNKKFFSAGIRSSQQSESRNQLIGFKASTDTSLTGFYKMLKETVQNWRSEEQKDEFNCSRSKAESIFKKAGMVKHASEVYTVALFSDFEKEFIKCVGASSKMVQVLDTTMVYDVESIGDVPSNRVIFDCTIKSIRCNCMKFEECGILCYHCLRILHINSVQNIPDAYILKRWTKLAKSQVWDKLKTQISEKETNDFVTWRNDMARKFYNLMLLCQGNKAARRIIEEGYDTTLISVKTTLMGKQQQQTSAQSASPTSITQGRSQKQTYMIGVWNFA